MKKNLLWLPIVMVLGAATYKPVKEAIEDKPVDKSISFAMFKGNNYTSDVYDYTSAQVHIIVEKVSGSKRTVVWDKNFNALQLKKFPTMQQAFVQTITIPNVRNYKEHLEVKYILTYDSQGKQLQMQSGTIVSCDKYTDTFEISI